MNTKTTNQNKKIINGIGVVSEDCSGMINSLYRLSHSSSFSSENELSFSLVNDNVENVQQMTNADELPAFEIRLLSPMSRSPSPIDNEIICPEVNILTSKNILERDESPLRLPGVEYVALHEINAQISPPSDGDNNNSLDRAASLETIYEGVFLSTPPRPIRKSLVATWSKDNHISKSPRVSLLEKEALNFIQHGKENRSSSSLQRTIFQTTLKENNTSANT